MKTHLLFASLLVGAGALAYGQYAAPDPSVNGPVVRNGTYYQGKAVIRLDVPGEISALHRTPFDNRETVIADVKKHVAEAHRDLLKLRVKNDVTFHRPSGDMKAQYDMALDNEKTARADVEARLKEAKATDDPESWEHARAALADSYQRYAQAVGNVEAIASGDLQPAAPQP